MEKQALLGGLATNGLISWYEPLCDGQGHQLIYGLAEELLRLSFRYGDDSLPEIWKDRSVPVDPAKVRPEKQHPIGGRYGTFFSPTLFQLAIDEVLLKEGVELRLDIQAVTPVVENGRVTGVVTESKSGRECFPAKAVVDASGDADLFDRAGVPCVLGKNFLSVVAHWERYRRKEKSAGAAQMAGRRCRSARKRPPGGLSSTVRHHQRGSNPLPAGRTAHHSRENRKRRPYAAGSCRIAYAASVPEDPPPGRRVYADGAGLPIRLMPIPSVWRRILKRWGIGTRFPTAACITLIAAICWPQAGWSAPRAGLGT